MDLRVRGAGVLRTIFLKKMANNTKKKYVRMVRCPNCGASYELGLLHCPYCKSVDDYQDESEYLEDLDELKDKLEDMPEDVLREQTKIQTMEAAKDFRKIFLIVGAAAAVILLLFGAGVFIDKVVMGNSDAKMKEKAQEEYLWKQENFPKLEELYEAKDYDGLLEFLDNTDNPGIYDWDHYPLIEGLLLLKYLPGDISSLEDLERNNETDSSHYLDVQAFLFRDELELLFFDCRKAEPEDIETIKGMSGEYLEDLETRFALTPEELETLEQKARKDMGSFYLSECKEFLKNR